MPDPEPLRWDSIAWDTPGAAWDGFQTTTNNTMSTNIKSDLTTDDVAVPFTQAKRDEIATDLIAVRDKLPILGQAPTAAQDSLQGIAEGREATVSQAARDYIANPGTHLGTVDAAKWALLEEQSEGLEATIGHVEELLTILRSTKLVTDDSRLRYLGRYYNYLGDNLDAIPGSKVIYDKIAVLYEKQGNRKPKTPPTGGNP